MRSNLNRTKIQKEKKIHLASARIKNLNIVIYTLLKLKRYMHQK